MTIFGVDIFSIRDFKMLTGFSQFSKHLIQMRTLEQLEANDATFKLHSL